MTIYIRPETPADYSAIHALTSDAFPNSTANEPGIVADLRAASALTLSLVAVDSAAAETIIGHIAFSPVVITPPPSSNKKWFGLAPISVAPQRQGHGVGRQLIEEGLAKLKSMEGVQGCVLLGDPKFYNRFGFMAGQGLGLAGVPPEYFMSCVLDGSECPTGEVKFHPAFDQSLTDADTKH
ncbi:GCN5-related N-acetyltransferase [Cordyceps fumosorosea ARSEF 2679]|uniref:GCN5-related N-acetyltransferase n=1 Tax=Cordyceps fumosorosea (strain ARSEF 2679) TaxID=1081104 RepID=A0A167M8C8_CORFA|nr:GCN5-related N-acetyltransferase [Cordyceps fumosorosea ARSEF 2679]OAA54061.1 GCN5-related N-acetyltransferase [Cordyceps fumosorosea ARSEF 2679]